MRIGFLAVLMAATLSLTSNVHAQDGEEVDPEGGDLGELGGDDTGGDDLGDMGGDEGSAEASFEGSSDDAGSGSLTDGGPAKPISVGLLLGYGISLEDGANPFGLGFGVRGGYNLGPIFLGARFVYYLGESESTGTGDASFNIWELGIEGGYDIAVAPLVIRPTLGLGLASVVYSIDVPGVVISGSTSNTELYIAPGASVLFDVTEDIFVGGEARLMVVLADTSGTALTLLANGGMRF